MNTEAHALILATTQDFFGKFEQQNAVLLQKMGFCVHYAANMNEPAYLSERGAIEAAGVMVHHIDIARSPFMVQYNQKALRQVLRLIHRYRIRLIHCHTPVGGLCGRLAGAWSTQAPLVIYTAHGFHFYKGAPAVNQLAYYRVEQALARQTDILIVINEEDYRAAKHFRLKKGGQLYKIPGAGLDVSRFSPISEEQKRRNRRRLGIGENAFFLVSAGELNQNKNQQVVLEALLKMRQNGIRLDNIRYGICGDGFFRERLQEQIQKYGLTDVAMLFGYRTDIPQVVGCADAAVFPSRREGLGMAGLEALAMGIPVIAADNRGTREYMEHGRNGYVCRYDDAEGFMKGIQTIMGLDAEKKRRMQAYCHASVRPFAREYSEAAMQRIYYAAKEKLAQKEERSREEHAGQSQYYHGHIQSR